MQRVGLRSLKLINSPSQSRSAGAYFGTLSKLPRFEPTYRVPQWKSQSTAFNRSMATKAEKPPKPTTEKHQPTEKAAPKASNTPVVKSQTAEISKSVSRKDLLKNLTQELEDLKTLENPDKSWMSFLQKSKFKLTEEEGVVSMTSQQPSQVVTVSFSTTIEADNEGDFGEDNFGEEGEMIETNPMHPEHAPSKERTNATAQMAETEEGELSETDLQQMKGWSPRHAMAIEIAFPNKKGQLKGKWILEAEIFKGDLNIVSMQTVGVDAAGEENDVQQTFFDHLSPEFQDSVINFLTEAGVDGELIQFVEEYVEDAQPTNQSKFLQNLKNLIAA